MGIGTKTLAGRWVPINGKKRLAPRRQALAFCPLKGLGKRQKLACGGLLAKRASHGAKPFLAATRRCRRAEEASPPGPF